MDYLVQQTKFQAETISIVMNFGDVLGTSTISGTPVVNVYVDSGIDSNPSGMLYQGVTVTNGQIVEQRIRLGIPGNIYNISFVVTSSTGQVFERSTYLAILPEDSVTVPLWLPYWRSTGPYPQQLSDSIQGSFLLTAGRLFNNVLNEGPDNIQGNFTLVSGRLLTNGITYNIPHEDIQGNIQLISGSLVNIGIIYSIPHEDIQGNIALIQGNLVTIGITYNIPHEDIQGNITLVTGTLV